jgi:hypothetical protein
MNEMTAALSDSNPLTLTHKKAFLALIEGDEERFRTLIEKRILAHRARFEKKPTDVDGIICLPVLMLCRVAIDRGMVLDERPYVPLRLLPNYKPTVH